MGIFTRSSPPAKTPSFFKVLIGDFSTHLRIPPAFVKQFDGGVPQESKIMKSTDDNVWHVSVQKMDQGFFFRRGWREFVEDNVLESGDLLVFHYFGNSKFEVTIYGKHCCEKELLAAPPAANNHKIQEKAKREKGERGNRSPPLPVLDEERQGNVSCNSDHETGIMDKKAGSQATDDDDDDDDDDECNINNGSDHHQIKDETSDHPVIIHIDSDTCSSDHELSMDTHSHRSSHDHLGHHESITKEDPRQRMNETKCKVKKEADACKTGHRLPKKVKARSGIKAASKFVSKYPFFTVVMQPTYLYKQAMRIPVRFSRIHFEGSSRKAKLWASGKHWVVMLSVHQRCCMFTTGWHDFVKDNALCPGDVCAFEMLQSDEVFLKVSFFRCMP